jgi:hypothetical protein
VNESEAPVFEVTRNAVAGGEVQVPGQFGVDDDLVAAEALEPPADQVLRDRGHLVLEHGIRPGEVTAGGSMSRPPAPPASTTRSAEL